MNFIDKIKKNNYGLVKENEDLKNYNSYKVSGKVKAVIYPYTINDLKDLIKVLRDEKVKYKVVGRGSNLIFSNDCYDGVLIRLDNLDELVIRDNEITVGSGYSLMKLSLKTARLGLTGLEFASGIPGSIGGSIYMNAGAYKSDMGYVVRSIRVLTDKLEIKTMYNHELDFHYRTSFLQKHPDYICLNATIVLKHGNKNDITDLIVDRRKRRMDTQPLDKPSAGSVFRNPEGYFSGALIEQIGYKGKKIGDAMVSDKHANFIINAGNAKGSDIKKLIFDIQEKVLKEKGIKLKVEQEFVE